MPGGERPPLDEWLSLFKATIAREGVTTGAGAGAGTSIVDAALIGAGDNSFISMLMVLYPGEPRNVDSMDITAFDNLTGEITYSSAYKGVAAIIPAGVPYQIVTFRFVPAEIAALAADIQGPTGIFHEQADAGFTEDVTAAEVFIVTLDNADTRYILRDLRVKSADPTIANTITVRLYTLINTVEVVADSFIITNANFANYFSLMDMFGVSHIAGDSIRISLQGSVAGPYVVTGQYSHAKTNV